MSVDKDTQRLARQLLATVEFVVASWEAFEDDDWSVPELTPAAEKILAARRNLIEAAVELRPLVKGAGR